MIKYFFSLQFLLSFYWSNNVFAQDMLWQFHLRGNISSSVDDAPAWYKDEHNHLYILSSFSNTLEIEKDKIKAFGESDLILLKINSKGQLLWKKSFGSAKKDHSGAISKAGDHRLLISALMGESYHGDYSDTLAHSSMVTLEIDTAGNFIRKHKDSNVKSCYPISDTKGSYYYASGFKNGLKIGSTVIPGSSTHSRSFIMKYNADKNQPQWVRLLGTPYGNSEVEIKDLGTDEKGNIFVVGCFSSLVTIDQFRIQSGQNQDLFLAKYTAHGDLQWILQLTESDDLFHPLQIKVKNHSVQVFASSTKTDDPSDIRYHLFTYSDNGSQSMHNMDYQWLPNGLQNCVFADKMPLSNNSTEYYTLEVFSNSLNITLRKEQQSK